MELAAKRGCLLPNIDVPAEKNISASGSASQTLSEGETLRHLHRAVAQRKALSEIDTQAEQSFSQLVNRMKQVESISEQLKANNQMAWVGQMNSIHNRAAEVVNREIIFTW